MRCSRTSAGLICVLCVLSLLLAAAPTDPAARPVIVTVTKNDGTTARGNFVSADPNGVTLRASAKADPTVVSWTQIKRVSNGITRPQVLKQWQKDHPEDVCADCHGVGSTLCATCHGTGFDQAHLEKCDKCGGDGVIGYCKHCVNGKVDCPAPCLKLSQGRWFLKEDGLRWRTFQGSSGGGWQISERHLGQLIVVNNGDPSPGPTCPTCNGTTKVDDPNCGGTGMIICDKCSFAGVVGPPCSDCKDGAIACKTCKGDGVILKRG